MEEKINILTEEDKESILKTMEEEVEKNENLKVLRDLPSNNGVEEHIADGNGESKVIPIKINPETGEQIPISDDDFEIDNESFDDFVKRIENSEINTDFNIEPKDVTEAISKGTLIGDYQISDFTTIELMKLIGKLKEDPDCDIKYKDLPDEVKKYVDDYLRKQGVVSFSAEANTYRNMFAQALINEYYVEIGSRKLNEDFNSQIEEIYSKSEEEISPLFMDYNKDKIESLNQMIDKVEDEEKKEILRRVIDSIHDAYDLNRFENEKKIKIKNFDLEDPKRSYSNITLKYQANNYHIYDPAMCEVILQRHFIKNKLIDENDTLTSRKIMIAFCNLCMNYDIKKPENHAFLYYFTYNITLLDIYKNEQYDEYATTFLNNVLKLLKNIK